ncbi:putative type II secretion system protein E [compost metagenome]
MSNEHLKAQARRLGEHLVAKHGVRLKHAALLEAVAAQYGHPDWNTLTALASAPPAPVPQPTQAPLPAPIAAREPAPFPDFSELGLGPAGDTLLERVRTPEAGCYIVAGTVGSGLSTTLRSITKTLTSDGKRVLAAHGFIEFDAMAGVTDWLWPHGRGEHELLQQLARVAPDVVVLDSVRSPEQARVARSLCELGMRVIVSMHATSPDNAIKRLQAMGPFPCESLHEWVSGALTQRLVRPSLCELEPARVKAARAIGLSPCKAEAQLFLTDSMR